MDVGADNFRFDLEDKNGRKLPTQTIRQPQTTELHLDSLDRYMPQQLVTTATFQMYPNNQNIAKLAGPILLNANNTGTQCVIQPGRPLAYGYYSRVALTQMFLKWECPTIVSGVNDTLLVQWGIAPGTISGTGAATIAAGYYTPATLAAAFQTSIRALNVLLGAMTITAPSATFPGYQFSAGGSTFMAFVFGSTTATSELQQITYGRTGKIMGLNRATYGYTVDPNTGGQSGAPVMWAAAIGGVPALMYTDYVDIVSQALTNYKDAKDGNSALGSPGGVIGRIWLTETTPNVAPAAGSLPNYASNMGSASLSLVKTWANPNWCQWSPNQTINTIDIALIDMFGRPIPWNTSYATEWSATLTLSE